MTDWLIKIIHNLTILLSLALIFQLLGQRLPRPRRVSRILLGVLFGSVAVFSMATAFVYQPGVVFDSRSIVLALAGLFGGGTSGCVAMVVAITYRGLLGGDGLWAGVATIVVSGSLGIGCRLLIQRRNWPPRPWQLWTFGVVVHLWVLGCLLLLPAPLRTLAMVNMAIPFLAAYPLVLMLLGMLMAKEEGWSSSLAHLKHAEWLFNQAQKVTRFGSWEYRLDDDELTATPYFHELLGLPENHPRLSLQDFFGRLHPDDWDAVRRAFDRAIGGQDEIDVHGRLQTDDGRIAWIRVAGKPIVVKGKTTQLVGNLIDITRRKTGELELRASEERLQAIIDHAPALICLCDLEGKITLANRRFSAFDGRDGSVVGRPLYELLPRGGALEQWIDDMLTLQDGAYVEFEETLQHSDGTVHIYQASKFLLSSTGNHPDQICYIAADVSELRHVLADLQQLTAELTLKNSELERFSYTVSHDLKAPLLTIGSYSTLLREDLDAGDLSQVSEDLCHIHDAVDNMRLLIDDLLGLSRTGRVTGAFTAVNLNEVVADVLRLLAGEIRQAGAEICVATELPVVEGDAARLRQVVQNLVQNAIKYRAADRPLRIDVNTWSGPDGSLQVGIRDNGRGIATADLQRVFHLFERVGNDQEGLGVGLALVQRIMERHGGSVRVESAGPGTGSTFVLTFPHPLPERVVENASFL